MKNISEGRFFKLFRARPNHEELSRLYIKNQTEPTEDNYADLLGELSRAMGVKETVIMSGQPWSSSLDRIDHKTMHRAWNAYGDVIIRHWRANNPSWKADPTFERELHKLGHFDPELVQRFNSVMEALPQSEFAISDTDPGYLFNDLTVVDLVERYNQIFCFKALSQEALDIIDECLSPHVDEITMLLGHNWRIVQTRYWEALAGGDQIGTNDWHKDGFPEPFLKILCFFTPPSVNSGSTMIELHDGAIKTIEGPAGTFMLFRNSALKHCGLPPKAGAGRATVEITIAPSFAMDANARFCGTNGHFPYWPWFVSSDAPNKIA